MQLNRVIKQYKNLITSAGIILLCVLGIFLGVIPLFQKSYILWQDMGALSSDISALEAKSNVLSGLSEESLRDDLSALTAAVPPDKSIATIFSTIDGMTATTGLNTADISLTNPGSIASASAKKKTASEQQFGGNVLPFSLAVTGGFEELRNFAKLSSGVRRFVRIRSIDIAFTTSQTVNAKIDMDTYYLPFPTALGAVGQAISPLSAGDQTAINQITALPVVVSDTFNASAGATIQTNVAKTDPFTP